MAREILSHPGLKIEGVFALSDWLAAHRSSFHLPADRIFEVTPAELDRISGLRSPNQVLVVLEQLPVAFDPRRVTSDLSLYLDGIQDPGNFGTILRVADWFGIPYVFCAPDCVDLYNPKVIQATMGAFLRVGVMVKELSELRLAFPDLPVFGALLEGEDLFTAELPRAAVIAIGNESQGLRPENIRQLTHRITIPGAARGGAESLNAGVAAGILCAVFRQRKL